jgi:hypothetical protein
MQGKVKELVNKVIQLGDISCDWKGTNHYEIHTENNYYWLDLSPMFSHMPMFNKDEFPEDTEIGKKLGLVLDVFENFAFLAKELERLEAENAEYKEILTNQIWKYEDMVLTKVVIEKLLTKGK